MKKPLRVILPVLLALLLLPLLPWEATTYNLQRLIFLFQAIVLAESYDILDGKMGYGNLGHISFFGVGAYAFGILFNAGLVFPGALALAAGVVVVFAAVMSYPFFRLRGAYFALATFGLVKLMEYVTLNLGWLTGGSNGLKIDGADRTLPMFFLSLALAVGAVTVSWAVGRSRLGLAMMSIREDEEVARNFGVPTYRVKVQALMISSIFPGLAGGLYTWYINYIIPSDIYGLKIALTPVAMALLGGSGQVVGPVIGSVFLYAAEETIWTNLEHLHGALFGAVVVFTGLFMPGGLARIPPVSRLLGKMGLLDAPR